MERAIVTVRHMAEDEGCDLEVPVTVTVQQLTDLLVAGLEWDASTTYRIWAEPPGRNLDPHETLAGAGVWDGAHLVLEPQTPAKPRRTPCEVQNKPTPRASEELPAEGPVTGWRDILKDSATTEAEDGAAKELSEDSSGYVWKRLD